MNGSVLEQVKYASENEYLGSADIENAKYLDSIEGKLSKLQNRIQELASITIDSEWLKTLIDLANKAMETINNLSERFGGLNIMITALATTVMTFKKNGFFRVVDDQFKAGPLIENMKSGLVNAFDLITNKFKKELPSIDALVDTNIFDLNSMFNMDENAVQSIETSWGSLDTFFEGVSEESKNAILSMESMKDGTATIGDIIDTVMKQSLTSIETTYGSMDNIFNSFTEKQKQSLSTVIQSIKDGTGTVDDLRQVIDTYNQNIVDEAQTSSDAIKNLFSSAGKKIKDVFLNVGATILNGVISFGISLLVSKGIELIVNGIHNIVYAEDIAIKKGEEAAERIQDIAEDFKKETDSLNNIAVEIEIKDSDTNNIKENLDGIAERYAKLKQGVNELTNANKSLTTEKYQEYLNICNKIAEQYPELVKDYDAQGNAILDLGDTAQECSKQLKEMYQDSMNISNIEIGKNMQETLDGALTKIEKLKKEIASLDIENEIKNIDNLESVTERSTFETVDVNDKNAKGIVIENFSFEEFSRLQDIFAENMENIPTKNQDKIPKLINPILANEGERAVVEVANFDYFNYNQDVLDEIYDEYLNGAGSSVKEGIQDALGKATEELLDDSKKQNTDKAKIAELFHSLTKQIDSYLSGTDAVFNMNESIQNAILGNFKFDEQAYKKYTDKYNSDFEQFIYGEVLTPLHMIVDNIDAQDQIADVLNSGIFNSNESLDSLRSQIDSMFRNIFGEEDGHIMMENLGILDMFSNLDNERKSIIDNLTANTGGLTIQQRYQILGMSPSDIENAFNLISNQTFKSFDKFIEAVKAKAKELAPQGLLSDIFGNEEFTSKSEAFEKKLSSITTALGTLGDSAGKLSGEALTSLREAMPDTDFGDYTFEDISDVGIKQLSEYVSLLYEMGKQEDLTAEGWANLNTYIQNLVMSYDSLSISAENLVNSLGDSYSTTLPSSGRDVIVSDFKEDIEAEFAEELGNEEDRKILYTLSLDSTSATWDVETWREKFDEMKVNWELILGLEEFNKSVDLAEARLSEAQEKANFAESEIERKNRNGDYNTEQELLTLIASQNAETEKLRNDLANLDNDNNTYTMKINQAVANGQDQIVIDKLIAERDAERERLKAAINASVVKAEDLAFEKVTLPLTIIDNDTLNELKRQYSEELVPALEEYGEDVTIPDSVYENIISNIKDQFSSNQDKINIIEDLLDMNLPKTYKDQLQTMKDQIEADMRTLTDNLGKYGIDLGIHNNQVEIANIESWKGMFQTNMDAKNRPTAEDYLGLNEFNEQLIEQYDEIAKTMSQEMNRITVEAGVEKEELEGSDKAYFALLEGFWKDAVNKSAELARETEENVANMNLLPEQELEDAISLRNIRRETRQSYRELHTAKGIDDNSLTSLNADISDAVFIRNRTQKQLDNLEANKADYKDPVEFEQKRLDYVKQINQEEANIAKAAKESSEYFLKASNERLRTLKMEGSEASRNIELAQKQGKKVNRTYLDDQYRNISQSLKENQSQQDFYNNLITAGKNPQSPKDKLIEARNNLVKSFQAGTLTQDYGIDATEYVKRIQYLSQAINVASTDVNAFGELYVKEWEDIVEELKDEELNLEGQKVDTKQLIDEQPLLEYGYKLDELKDKAQDFQEVLNNPKRAATKTDYQNVIDNAVEQQANLNNQIALTEQAQKGLDFNDPEYQRLEGILRGLNDDYDALTETIEQSQEAIDNYDLNKTIKKYEEYQREIELFIEKQDNFVSLGGRMDAGDYDERIDYYTNAMTEAYSIAQDKLADAKNVKEGSQDRETLMGEYEQYMQDYRNNEQLILKAEQEKMMLPVEDLKREQKDIQQGFNDIEDDINRAKQEGRDIPDAVYEAELQSIADETKNLNEQRKEYTSYLNKAQKDGLDELADQMKDNIEDVDSQLSSLASKEFEIQLLIDSHELTNLQEEYGYLERESQNLQDALSDPYSSTKSREEILNEVITTGGEMLNNLTEQAEEYQETMDKIVAFDPDFLHNDRYIEASQGLDSVNSSIRNVTKSIREAGEEIKNLPYEKLERLLNARNQSMELNASERGLVEARGGQLTSADYAEDINIMRGNIGTLMEEEALRQKDMLEKQALLNSATASPDIANISVEQATKDYEEASTAYNEAKIAVNNAQKELAETESQAMQANQDVYNSRIGLLQNLREGLDAQRQVDEAMGKERTSVDVAVDLNVSNQMKKDLEDQLADLDANHVNMTPLEYSEARLNITKQIRAEEQGIVELQKELVEKPLEGPQKALEALQRSRNELDRMIGMYEYIGKDIPDNLLADKLLNIDAQISQESAKKGRLQGLINIFQPLFGDAFVSGWKDQLEDVENNIDNLNKEKIDTNKIIDEKPLKALGHQLDVLKKKHGEFTELMEKGVVPKTAENYKTAIKNATEEQANLAEQIKMTKEEQDNYTEADDEYWTLQSTIDSLEGEYEALASSVDEWGKAIRDLPLNSAVKDLEDYENRLERVRTRQGYFTNLGGVLTEEDYQENIDNYEEAAEKVYNLAQKYAKKADEEGVSEDDQAAYKAKSAEYMARYEQYTMDSILSEKIAKAKAPTAQIDNQITHIRNLAQATQNEIDALTEAGLTGTEEQYQAMINYHQSEMNAINRKREARLKERDDIIAVFREWNKENPDQQISLENNPVLEQIDEEIEALDVDMQKLTDDTLQFSLMINGGIDLAVLNRQREELERETSAITNEIGLAESRGLTPSIPLYEEMVSQTQSQILNLIEIRSQLERQQKTAGITIEEYNRLSGEISNIDSSIYQTTQTLDEYNRKLVSYGRTFATELSSAINTVLSESTSETGVSAQAMETLRAKLQSLADANNFDISSLFYSSAEGIKVNYNALNDLIKLQGRSYGRELINKINAQTKAIAEQKKAIDSTGKAKVTESKQTISQLKEELAGYQAIMKSIEEVTSLYGQWKQAQSAPNEADRYDEIYQNLAQVEEHLNSSGELTVADEQFIKLLSGREGTAEEFERLKPIIGQFFQQGDQGLKNFVDYLVENGLGTVENGQYSFEDLNVDEIMKLLQIESEDAVMAIFDKLDAQAGFTVNVSPRNGMEAYIQSQEKQQEYLDALDNQYKAQQEGNIESAQYWKSVVDTALEEVEKLNQFEEGNIINEEELNYAKNLIQDLQNQLANPDIEIDEELIKAKIQEISQAYGVNVSEDLTKMYYTSLEDANNNLKNTISGFEEEEEVPITVTLSQKSLDQMSEMHIDQENLTNQVQEALDTKEFALKVDVEPMSENEQKFNDLMTSFANQKYGNIDLTNRQPLQLDDGSVATVLGSWDNTFKVNGENVSVAFSPLLQTENGPIQLNSDTLYDYIQKLLDMATTEEGLDYDLFLNLDQKGMYYQDILDATGKNWGGLLIKGMIAGFDTNNLIEESNMAGIISEIMHQSEEGTTQSVEEALTRIADALDGESAPEVTIPVTTDNEKFVTLIQDILDSHGSFKVTLEPVIPTASSLNATLPSTHAFAQGTTIEGGLSEDTTALTNELGTEGLVRNGVLTEIPGGMHIQEFKKGDVIINSRQMEELKKNGKATGNAKIIGGKNALCGGTCDPKKKKLGAFAHGTLSGLPAFANNINASGYFANTVNPNTQYTDELNKAVNTVIDRIPKYLETLNKEISRLERGIKEYTDTTKKREAYEDKMGLIFDEMNANLSASIQYQNKALTYEEKLPSGAIRAFNVQDLLDLYNSQNNKHITLQDVVTGRVGMDEFSSSEQDQRVVRALEHYTEYMDKAQGSVDANLDLVDSLEETKRAVINLPFDKLNKDLEKLGRRISSLDAIASTASSGEAALATLNQLLGTYLGESINISGKPYDVQNRLNKENIELQKEEASKNVTALNEAKANLNNSVNDYENLNAEFGNLKDSLISELSAILEERDLERLRQGKSISTRSISGYDSATANKLNDYNLAAEETNSAFELMKEAEDKVDEQYNTTKQKLANLAVDIANYAKQAVENIQSYYGALISYSEAIGQSLANNTNYIRNWFKLAPNAGNLMASYDQQIQNVYDQTALRTQMLGAVTAQLNEALATIPNFAGSKEHYELLTIIQNLQNEIDNAKNTVNEFRKAQIDLPNEIVQEKLGDITAAYNELTTAMEKNVAQSYTTMQAYNKLASLYGGTLFNLDGITPEFMYQNQLLGSDLSRAEEEAQVAIQGYQQALANYQAGGPAEEYKMREDALRTAEALKNEKMAEAAIKLAQYYEGQLQNIQTYYTNINNLISTEIDRLEKRNDLIEQSNDIAGNAGEFARNVTEIVEDLYGRTEMTANSINYMKQVLAEGLASGRIVEFDQTWTTIMTMIRNSENEVNSLGNEVLATYQKLIQLPEKELDEALDRLEKRFKGFAAVVSNSIDTVTKRYNLSKINAELGEEFGDIGQYDIDLSSESFVQGIKTVDTTLEKEKEKLEDYKQYYRDATDVVYQLQGDGLTTPEAMEGARQAQEEAKTRLLNQAGVVAALEAQQTEDYFKTIDEYFKNITDNIETYTGYLSAQREALAADTADPYIMHYDKHRDLIEDEMKMHKQNASTYEEEAIRLRNILTNSGLSPDSEEYRNLQNQIIGIENQAMSSLNNVRKLAEEAMSIPEKLYEEHMANIDRLYGSVSAKIQTGMFSSISQLKNSRYGNYDFNDPEFRKYMRYDAQNALLAQDTKRAQNEAKAAKRYRDQAQAEYERIQNDENYTNQDRIKALRKLQDANKEYATKAGEAGQTTVNNFKQMTDNINKYFSTVNASIDASINKVQTLNNILQETSTIYGTNYSGIQVNDAEIITETAKKYQNTLQDAVNEQAYLDLYVKQNKIVEGDTDWLEATTKITNLRNEAEGLRLTVIQLYKDFLQIPANTLSKGLEEITSKFAALNSVMSNNITESDTAMYYHNYNRFGAFRSSSASYKVDTSNPSYVARNQLIVDSLEQQKETVARTMSARDKAKRNYEQVRRNKKSEDWEINLAKEEWDKLRQQATEEQDKLFSEMANAPMKFLENIKSFYDTENNYLDTLNNNLSASRGYISDFISYLGKMSDKQNSATKIIRSYVGEMNNYSEQIANTQTAINQMNAQLEENYSNGTITGQDYKEAQQLIAGLEAQLTSAKRSQMELFQEMIRVPTKVIEEQLNTVELKYNMFDQALSAGLFNTTRGTELYKQATAMFDKILGGTRSSIMPTITGSFTKSIGSYLSSIGEEVIDIPEIIIEPDDVALEIDDELFLDLDDILIEDKIGLDDLFEEELIEEAPLTELFNTSFNKIQEMARNTGAIIEEELLEEDLNGVYLPATTPNIEPDLYPEYVVTDDTIKGTAFDFTPSYENQNKALSVNIEKLKEIAVLKGQQAVAEDKIYESVLKNKDASDERKEAAKRAAQETAKEAEDAMVDYLKAIDSAFSDIMNNATSYFGVIDSWFSAINSKMRSIREYSVDVFGHLSSASLVGNMIDKEIENNETLMTAYANEIKEIKRYINEGLENNLFTEGDEQYLEWVQKIPELTEKYVGVASNNMANFRTKYGEANEIVAEDIEKLIEAFSPLDTVMNNMSTLGSQRKLSALGYEYSFRNNGATNPDLTAFAYDKTYIGQNIALELDTERERLKLESYHEAVLSTKMALDAAKGSVDTTKEEVIAAEEEHKKALENFNNQLNTYNNKWVANTMQAVENVNSYYANLASHYDTVASRAENARKMIDRFDRTLDMSGKLTVDTTAITKTYSDQIDNLKKKQNMLSASIAFQTDKLEEIGNELGTDSEEYIKLSDQIVNMKNQYEDATIAMDDLYDAQRQELYFKPIDNEIDRLKSLSMAFGSLKDLISADSMITEQGDYTQYGKIAIGLTASQREAAEKELEQLSKKYRVTYEQWRKDGAYQDSELLADLKDIQDKMQSAVKEYQSSTFAMIDIAKNRYQEEINYIKKLIQSEKEELAKKKELNDYDKSLKQKTNSVRQIEAEIRAIEGLNDLESRSQRARLQEQLKNSRDELDDTVQSHVVEMRQEGLDKLSEKLDEGFEKYVKDISVNMLKQDEMADIMKTNIDRFNGEVNSGIQDILDVYGKEITPNMYGGFDSVTKNLGDIKNTDLLRANALNERVTDQTEQLQKSIDQASQNVAAENERIEREAQQKQYEYEQSRKADDDLRNSYLNDILAVDGANLLMEANISETLKNVIAKIGEGDMSLMESITADIEGLYWDITGFLNNPYSEFNKTMTTTISGVKAAIQKEAEEKAVIPTKLEDIRSTSIKIQEMMQKFTGQDDEDNTRQTSLADILQAIKDINISFENTKPDAISEDVVEPQKPKVEEPEPKKTNNNKNNYDWQNISDPDELFIDTSLPPDNTPYWIAPPESVIEETNTSTSGKNYPVEIKNGQYWVDLGGNNKRLIRSNEFKAGFMLIDGVKYDVKQAKIMATKTIKPRGYSKGTLNASPGLAQINERNMLEALLTKNATYIPFEGGEGVVPAKQTRAIVDFANSLLRNNSSTTDDLSRLLGLQNSLIAEEQQLSQYIARNQSTQTAEETQAMLNELDNLRNEIEYTEMIASNIHSAFESNLDQNDTAISYFNALNESNAEQNYLIDLMSTINSELKKAQIEQDENLATMLQEELISVQKRINELMMNNSDNFNEIIESIRNEVINKIEEANKETTHATDNTKMTIIDLIEKLDYVTDGKNLVNAIEGMSSGKFGNIDLNDRHILEWTEENKKKYNGVIDPSLMDGISTVLGGWQDFSRNGQDFSLAYSPMLQTAKGARLLDADTAIDYLNTIIDKTFAKYGTIDLEKILEQDRQGARVMDNMTNTIIRVHDMIAGFSDSVTPGNVADFISQLMHSYETGEVENAIGMVVDTISTEFTNANIPDLKSDVDEADLYNLLSSILSHDTQLNMSLSDLYESVVNNASNEISWSIKEGSGEIQHKAEIIEEELNDTILTTEEVLYDNLEDNFSNLNRETARNGQAIIEMRKTMADFAKKNVEIQTELMNKIMELEESHPDQSGEILLTDDGPILPSSWMGDLMPNAVLELQEAMNEFINSPTFQLNLPDMSAYQPVERIATTSNNTNNELYVESLITINGDATSDTVDKIKEIASELVRNKQFQENVTSIVSKRQAQDRKMSGARTSIK